MDDQTAKLFTHGQAPGAIQPDLLPMDTAPKDVEILLFCVTRYPPPGRDCAWWEVGFWGSSYLDEDGWTEGRDRAPLPAVGWRPLPIPAQYKDIYGLDNA